MGELRAKMVDDRAFKDYLKKNPDARGCEGYSRGYFETERGVISIKKYFVHLRCYKPFKPHPMSAQYFRLTGAKKAEKDKFNEWLASKEKGEQKIEEEVEEKPAQKKRSVSKKKK